MAFHRLVAGNECSRDFSVAFPGGDQAQHLQITWREAAGELRPRRRATYSPMNGRVVRQRVRHSLFEVQRLTFGPQYGRCALSEMLADHVEPVLQRGAIACHRVNVVARAESSCRTPQCDRSLAPAAAEY